jgi:hypothetical protein
LVYFQFVGIRKMIESCNTLAHIQIDEKQEERDAS